MDLSRFRKRSALAFGGLLAMTVCAGTMQASNSLITVGAITGGVTCNTATGQVGASPTFTVTKAGTALTSSQTVVVTPVLPAGLSIAPTSGTLSSSTTTLTFTVSSVAAPCTGFTTGTPNITFTDSETGTVVASGTDTATRSVAMTLVQGSNLSSSGATVTCQLNAGPTYVPGGVQTVTVTGPSAGQTFSISGAPSYLTVGAPSGAANTSGATFTVVFAAGCGGLSAGTTNATLTLTNTGTNTGDQPLSVTITLTVGNQPASNLTAVPAGSSTLSFTCLITPGSPTTYTGAPSGAQTINVSTASGTQAFSVSAPSWLTAGSPSGSATTTAATFTLTLSGSGNNTCGGITTAGTTTGSVTITNTGNNTNYAPQVLTVTLVVATASPLSALNPVSLTYVKGSGSPGTAIISVKSTATPSPFFTLDTTTLPTWLTATPTTGTATTAGANLTLTTTSVCDSLAPGSYTATVHFKVSGSFDKTLSVSLFLNTGAPTLTVSGSLLRTANWTLGTALPTFVITAVSSDSPISYKTSTSGPLQPIVASNEQEGLAYSFGTPINVSFPAAVFAAAQPGQVLTGTVTITWGSSGSTIVVSFSVTVEAPGATVTSLSPGTLPASPTGTTFTVTILGTGFVTSTSASQKTRVGFVATNAGGNLISDAAITNVNVVSASEIIVTIVAPTAGTDNYLQFNTTTNATSYLAVCNPAVATPCPAASGWAQLTISAGPLIQAVTSSSGFVQVTPPALPTVAPYDMISLFGAGFCPLCSSGQILQGAPAGATLTYASAPTLTPNPNAANPSYLTVAFVNHSTGAAITNGAAPLLFATNNQINLLVPAAVAGQSTVDIVVSFGYGTVMAGTLSQSARFPVNVAATDPGIFTVGADGQGSAAVLDVNYDLISATNPAGMRTGAVVASDSDTIQLYVTGLGLPDTGASWSSTNCITVPNYLSALATATGTTLPTLDGTVVQSSLLNGDFAPCLASSNTNLPIVTIGGIPATVTFAGFVADTIAGLYQIDAQLPSSVQTGSNYFVPLSGSANEVQAITAPIQLPVVIQTGSSGPTSQQGVTLWVAPRLYVSAPTFSSCTPSTCAVGVAWPANVTPSNPANPLVNTTAVAAAEGTGAYHYAITKGVLPTGLTLTTSGSPAIATIVGTPAAGTAGTYPITITASDSANVPVTGSIAFTITVYGGLVVTSSSGTGTGTFGTANTTMLPTITPTGGTFPYTFAISSSPAPLGMTVVPSGCTNGANPCTNGATAKLETAASTPAGTYVVNVTATDSATTPVTGSVSGITITVAPKLTVSTPTPQPATTAGVLVTVTAQTGNTNGTVVYSLNEYTSNTDGTPLGSPSGLSLDTATGNLTPGTAVAGTYYLTVTATDSAGSGGSMPPGASAYGTATTTNITVVVQ